MKPKSWWSKLFPSKKPQPLPQEQIQKRLADEVRIQDAQDLNAEQELALWLINRKQLAEDAVSIACELFEAKKLLQDIVNLLDSNDADEDFEMCWIKWEAAVRSFLARKRE